MTRARFGSVPFGPKTEDELVPVYIIVLFHKYRLWIRKTVGTRIRSCVIGSSPGIVKDRLAPSHLHRVRTANSNFVTSLGKLLQRRQRHATFDGHIATARRFLEEPRRLQRLLQIHAEVHDVGHELGMSQRLVCAAHDSESNMFVAAFHKGGNDGMKRALSARKHIGMIALKREAPAAIVEDETLTLNSDARAEVVGDTLNPTYDVAGAIDNRQVCRIALYGPAGQDITVGVTRVDECCSLARVVFREQDT